MAHTPYCPAGMIPRVFLPAFGAQSQDLLDGNGSLTLAFSALKGTEVYLSSRSDVVWVEIQTVSGGALSFAMRAGTWSMIAPDDIVRIVFSDGDAGAQVSVWRSPDDSLRRCM